MAVSDVLWQAVEDIREYQEAGIITSYGDHAVNLVVAIMDAVRLQPGRDRSPGEPDTFDVDLRAALAWYYDAPRRDAVVAAVTAVVTSDVEPLA